MKGAIISGATGCIGIALIKELIKNNVKVMVLAHKGSVRNNFIPESPLVNVEFCDLKDIKNFTIDGLWDVFYDFAWEGGLKRDDVRLQYANIGYALDAVEFAARIGCKIFIGAGSQAEFGITAEKLTANTKTNPVSAFGIAKLCVGQLSRQYAHQLGLKHIWTRILSVYGPNDGAETMITTTINKLLKGERAPFTKGEQLWDYLYSGDAAEAFRLLGEKGVDGKTYILGSGKARPLADFIRIIARECGAEDKIDLGAIPYAQKQVMHLEADISELTKDVGWVPSTKFEEGIKIAVDKMRLAK